MEKLLNAFASGLLIQYPQGEGKATKEADDEQKAAFVEAVKKHMAVVSEVRSVGYVLTYDYHQGKIRGGIRSPHESTVESANGNMLALFYNLPELPKGESYAFPVPTFISFEIKMGIGLSPKRVCPWIQQQL